MSNLAEFEIVGSVGGASPAADKGFDAQNSETLTLRLEGALSGLVRTIHYSVADPAVADSPIASGAAPQLSLDNGTDQDSRVKAATPDADVTVEMPASGTHTYNIRCEANGGRNQNGKPDPDYVFERIVAIRSSAGARKILYTEMTEYSDESWADAFNELIDLYESSSGVADGSITTTKLADDAVTGTKLADGSVDTAAVALDAITTNRLADSAVSTDKLQVEAVSSAKIQSNAVSNEKLTNDAVDTPELVDGAVTTAKLASAAVTPDKIAQYLDVVFTAGRTVQALDLGKLIIFTGAGTLTMDDVGPEYGGNKRPFVLVYGFGDITISGGGTTDGLTIPEGQMVTLLKFDDTNSWISMSPLS